MKELIESKWQEILNILVKEHEISEVAVNTWIQPLTIQTISDDSITFFMVRGPRGIEFIKHKYYVNVPLDRIKNGSYNIALNIDDKIYTTEYFIKSNRLNCYYK